MLKCTNSNRKTQDDSAYNEIDDNEWAIGE